MGPILIHIEWAKRALSRVLSGQSVKQACHLRLERRFERVELELALAEAVDLS